MNSLHYNIDDMYQTGTTITSSSRLATNLHATLTYTPETISFFILFCFIIKESIFFQKKKKKKISEILVSEY